MWCCLCSNGCKVFAVLRVLLSMKIAAGLKHMAGAVRCCGPMCSVDRVPLLTANVVRQVACRLP